MFFYKITLQSAPQIVFAHAYKTTEYKRSSGISVDFFEISHIISGDIHLSAEIGQYVIPAPGIHSCLYDYSFTSYCKTPHHHETVGIRAVCQKERLNRDQVLELWQNSFSNRVTSGDTILLPEIITDAKYLNPISDVIKKIIYDHSLGTHSSSLTALSALYALFSLLTDCAVNMATAIKGDISYGETAYCSRAIAYISKNVDKQISVPEMAQALNISVGYLSRIFRAVTGVSIINYANSMKIERAKQLLLSGNASITEISDQLGMTDEKYFCRLFKKHTGTTASEYRKAHLQ